MLYKDLLPGTLIFPLELGVKIGSPVYSSKNNFLLVDCSNTRSEGTPLISIINPNCSYSFSPGNMGYPVNSSANMQPKLHISIDSVYGMPNIISGAL